MSGAWEVGYECRGLEGIELALHASILNTDRSVAHDHIAILVVAQELSERKDVNQLLVRRNWRVQSPTQVIRLVSEAVQSAFQPLRVPSATRNGMM